MCYDLFLNIAIRTMGRDLSGFMYGRFTIGSVQRATIYLSVIIALVLFSKLDEVFTTKANITSSDCAHQECLWIRKRTCFLTWQLQDQVFEV